MLSWRQRKGPIKAPGRVRKQGSSLAVSWKKKTVIVNLHMVPLLSSDDLGQCCTFLCERPESQPLHPQVMSFLGRLWLCVHCHSFPLLGKK